MRFGGLFVLILLSQVVTVITPQAASFDCTQKHGIFENAICSDDELSALDQALSTAFKAARSKVSDGASQEILAGQRRWHDYAQKVCVEDMSKPDAEYGDVGKSCLQTTFENRIDVLDSVRAHRGLIFYSHDNYSAFYTENPEDWSRIADHVSIAPQLDAMDEQAERFNAYMRQEFKPADLGDTSADLDAFEFTSNLEYTGKVSKVTLELITIELDYYSYGHGAAHGNYAINYMHFLRGENRPLTVNDIFIGTDWLDVIRPHLLASIKQQLGDMSIWEDLPEFDDLVLDVSRWSFDDYQLSVQFQPYEVSAYAAGAPVGYVDWRLLEPYLVPGAHRIIGLK